MFSIKLNNFCIFGTLICYIKQNKNKIFNTIINTEDLILCKKLKFYKKDTFCNFLRNL